MWLAVPIVSLLPASGLSSGVEPPPPPLTSPGSVVGFESGWIVSRYPPTPNTSDRPAETRTKHTAPGVRPLTLRVTSPEPGFAPTPEATTRPVASSTSTRGTSRLYPATRTETASTASRRLLAWNEYTSASAAVVMSAVTFAAAAPCGPEVICACVAVLTVSLEPFAS